MNEIDISIIIVSYNTEQITYDCVKSIFDSETKYTFEIIVVDNNSSDNTVMRLESNFPTISIIKLPTNAGFSKGNNIGIDKSNGKYLLLLNSDTLLLKNSLEELLKTAIDKQYFITGPVLLNLDLTVQRSWFDFPSATKIFLRLTDVYTLFYKLSKSFISKFLMGSKKPAFLMSEIIEDTTMDYLTFACILIKRNVIDEIGKLDEGLFFYQEDCEYGLRAKKNNYKFYYSVSAKIIHLGGTSSGKSSWVAFENDILGLLHIYKKHYQQQEFKKIKKTISIALLIRIVFSYFGLFNNLKKSSLYNKGQARLEQGNNLRNKYMELRKTVKNYS